MSAAVLPRLLHLLEVLGRLGTVPGPRLAETLGVDTRTVRRDVERLRALGYEVGSVRGRDGGYRLVRSRRIPPLVVDDEQAAALVLGLDALRLAGIEVGGVVDLGDHLVRLLPSEVAERVEALRDALGRPPTLARPGLSPTRLLDLGVAVRDGHAVHLRYTAGDGETTERTFEPWGVVEHARRWYVAGHDHLRDAVRVLRVDRITALLPAGRASVPRPAELDVRELVVERVTTAAWRHDVEVLLHAPTQLVARRFPITGVELTEEEHGTVLRTRAEDLTGMARMLAGAALPCTVRRPVQLREELAAVVETLASSVARAGGDRPATATGRISR